MGTKLSAISELTGYYNRFEFITYLGILEKSSIFDFSTQPHRLFIFQVFYFQEVAYPPQKGRFQGHVEWSGDILKRDASITLINVPPTFNGTYICQVRNRPDVHGSNGEIMLRVVDKGQAACLGEL